MKPIDLAKGLKQCAYTHESFGGGRTTMKTYSCRLLEKTPAFQFGASCPDACSTEDWEYCPLNKEPK